MLGWPRCSRRLFAVGLLLSAIACTQTSPRVTNVSDVSVPEDRVGIDDTFDVRVYGEADLSGMFRVAPDGTVDSPLAGRLQVAGRVR